MKTAPSDQLLFAYLVVAALLFVLGTIGFLCRRNAIITMLSVGLMLQGAALTLIGFSTIHATWSGQVFSLFALAVTAVQSAIILILVQRS